MYEKQTPLVHTNHMNFVTYHSGTVQMSDVKGCYWQQRMAHLLAISLPLSEAGLLTRAST